MSQLILQITNGANDGLVGLTFNSTAFEVDFGRSASLQYNAFFLWTNVTIPQGSIITSAIITFKAYRDRPTLDCKANIYFNNEDNAIAPTSEVSYTNKTTTSGIEWNPTAWIKDNNYNSPNLSSILTTVINRVNWQSGNNLMVLIKDNSSVSATKIIYSYDYSPNTSAILTIDYIEPITVNAGSDQNKNSEFTQTATVSEESILNTVLWEKVSGPGIITFGSSDSLSTTISASEEGEYIIQITVTDINNNQSIDSFNLTWDTTGPNITGVTDNTTYTSPVTITFNEGTATLNGQNFESGSTVSSEGSYILIATDQIGNNTLINFYIKNNPHIKFKFIKMIGNFIKKKIILLIQIFLKIKIFLQKIIK